MTLGSVTSVSSRTVLDGTRHTPGANDTPAIGDGTSTQLSSLIDTVKQLQGLQESDPDQFKEVMSKLSKELKQRSDSTGDKFLGGLSDRFAKAGETGDMSLLQPPQDPPPRMPRGFAAYSSGQGPSMTPDDIAQLMQNALSSVTDSSSGVRASAERADSLQTRPPPPRGSCGGGSAC
jgi:hypothetical protein